MKEKKNKDRKIFRIAVDARPLSTPVSGVGKLITSVLRGFDSDTDFEFLLFSHRPIHEGYSELLKNSNIRVVIGDGPFAKKGGLYFAFYLPFQLRKHKIDLFWGTQQVFPLFLPKQVPGVLTYHDFVAYRFPETMRPIARLQQLFYLRRSIRRADFVLANSEFTAKELQTYYSFPKEKIEIVYPGYSPKEIVHRKTAPTERTKKLSKRFFLTVSTLEPRKNYQILWKAYQALQKENPKFPGIWVHAGKAGWESPEFLEEFKEASQKGSLHWIDSATEEELQYLYSNADLFLFPSIYEGFGIPLLEALAYSIPCIVSDLEVFREIGGESCFYISPDSKMNWKNSILEYYKKPKKLKKPDLKKFERTVSVKKTKKIFLDLLSHE
ncbi:glycosyltransferase family 1 protein [Leptospira langatensis]|uniref:Glycosyltransferase family 1 protein n=1 Tax=Leptospira langatensis TaxID=2484983 RepID=A0A5F1ZPC2_9LEPT|nr:glycosyltransferase family 1 protein [Leptospira langatensis]TGK05576.1 glycosyltransferase family 1 protein [Leptospira langatensis]TGL38708.1 glycosyltransferase family 1 protein [Leptospira langatensis]